MAVVTTLLSSLPMVEYDRLNVVLRGMKTDLIKFFLMVPVHSSFLQKRSCFFELTSNFLRKLYIIS